MAFSEVGPAGDDLPAGRRLQARDDEDADADDDDDDDPAGGGDALYKEEGGDSDEDSDEDPDVGEPVKEPGRPARAGEVSASLGAVADSDAGREPGAERAGPGNDGGGRRERRGRRDNLDGPGGPGGGSSVGSRRSGGRGWGGARAEESASDAGRSRRKRWTVAADDD